MGTSGASTSTIELSTPSPEIAASKCSTVEMDTPLFSRDVAKVESDIVFIPTLIGTASERSVLVKTIPVSSLAGFKERDTSLPE